MEAVYKLAIYLFMSGWAIGGILIVASLSFGLWLMLHTRETKEINKAEERLRANQKSANQINEQLRRATK